MAKIAKTAAWIVVFGLLGLSLAPAIASAPQQYHELRYMVIGGLTGIIVGGLVHRP